MKIYHKIREPMVFIRFAVIPPLVECSSPPFLIIFVYTLLCIQNEIDTRIKKNPLKNRKEGS